MSNLRLKVLITILGDDSVMGSKIDKKKYITGWLISNSLFLDLKKIYVIEQKGRCKNYLPKMFLSVLDTTRLISRIFQQ